MPTIQHIHLTWQPSKWQLFFIINSLEISVDTFLFAYCNLKTLERVLFCHCSKLYALTLWTCINSTFDPLSRDITVFRVSFNANRSMIDHWRLRSVRMLGRFAIDILVYYLLDIDTFIWGRIKTKHIYLKKLTGL